MRMSSEFQLRLSSELELQLYGPAPEVDNG